VLVAIGVEETGCAVGAASDASPFGMSDLTMIEAGSDSVDRSPETHIVTSFIPTTNSENERVPS
jgi:hypothetical protein